MMWDFGNRSQDNLQVKAKGRSRSRSRSRSPQPPQMRIPSPSFPVAQTNSHHSPTNFTYGSTLTATAPYPQVSPSSYQPPSPSYRPSSPYRSPSPYRAPSPSYPPQSSSYPRAPSPAPYSYNMTHNYPTVPRGVPVSPTSHYSQTQAPQVIHVIHHSSHHHSSSKGQKHSKHKPHHSHSYSTQANASSSSGAASMPIPITHSTSYYSAPSPTLQVQSQQHPQRSHHQHHHSQPSYNQQLPQPLSASPNHRVHFPPSSQMVTQPVSILKPPRPRTRVHSQPTMPTASLQISRPVPKPGAGYHQHQQPTAQAYATNQHFQHSKCTGHKRALCIGINYRGQQNELRGCVNDAQHVRAFLIKYGNYKATDIVILTDDARDPRAQPTRDNIIDAMRWLVRGAHKNDSLFFHYSGHGGQTKDLDGDEVDGFDEVIYPVDYKTKGHIVDDLMHDLMVKPLPEGCRLTGLFDACHSGTVLDLPYIYSSHGRLKGNHISSRARDDKKTRADVISWSGCKDGQTSADTFSGGVAVGAMSNAFIQSLKQKPAQTYQELLTSVRHILSPRYSQKPQLGSSYHIDTNLQFIF